LTAEQIATAEESGGADPRAIFIKKVLERIAADCHLVTMPQLSAENVKKRLASLAHHDFDNPLPVLAELRYYQSKKLSRADRPRPSLRTLPRSRSARQMLGGDESETPCGDQRLCRREMKSAAALRCFLLRINAEREPQESRHRFVAANHSHDPVKNCESVVKHFGRSRCWMG